jgi:hypothetical protein
LAIFLSFVRSGLLESRLIGDAAYIDHAMVHCNIFVALHHKFLTAVNQAAK